MLIPVVPSSLDNLACVTFVLFDTRICKHANIVVYIKIEEWARFAPRFRNNKVVEGIMLRQSQLDKHKWRYERTCGMMRSSFYSNCQHVCDCATIISTHDIHQVVHARSLELVELLADFLQEASYGVSLFALCTSLAEHGSNGRSTAYSNDCPMSGTIPI